MNPLQCRMGRAALGWSGADLARAAGVTPRTVIRYEADEAVNPETARKLAEALEREGVVFIDSGSHRGGVLPPAEGR